MPRSGQGNGRAKSQLPLGELTLARIHADHVLHRMLVFADPAQEQRGHRDRFLRCRMKLFHEIIMTPDVAPERVRGQRLYLAGGSFEKDRIAPARGKDGNPVTPEHDRIFGGAQAIRRHRIGAIDWRRNAFESMSDKPVTLRTANILSP
jgi:hypothetical protein